MNLRKIKIFLKFHWIKILVIIGGLAIFLSLVIFIRHAVNAWVTSESYFKKASLAQYAIFFYVIIISHFISMPLYALFWYWLMFRGGRFKFTSLKKKKHGRRRHQYPLE